MGHYRRNLQAGVGRDDHWQVRSREQGIRWVPGRPHDGLPKSERDRCWGNRILARAETHAAAGAYQDIERSIGDFYETLLTVIVCRNASRWPACRRPKCAGDRLRL